MTYENAARQQTRRRWWLRAVGILACVVVFITVYALVLPAITMERGTPTCGLEEHTHDAECYDAEGELTCTLQEHVHGDACFAEETQEPDAEEAAAEPAAPEESAAEPEESAEPEVSAEPVMLVRGTPAFRAASGTIMDGYVHGEANDWQIVDGKYEGNAVDNKTHYSSDGTVRVQKNVIPTDVENEFAVYLSIDTKESIEKFFQIAEYSAVTRGNYTDDQLGHFYPGTIGSSEVSIGPEETPTRKKDIYFTIKDEAGTILAKDLHIFFEPTNVFTCYIIVDNGFIPIGTKLVSGTHNEITLYGDALQEIENQLVNTADLKSVTDAMGEYITYVGLDDADGTVTSSGNSITWTPEPKANPEKVKETVEVDGKEITTTWSLNIAELRYRVRLDVTKAGFMSCADTLNDSASSPCYAVNSKATLTYGTGSTVDFPIPHVRGLLYDIKGLKVAKGTNEKLPNAQFTLTPGGATATSGPDGTFSFEGLPWGDYTVTETKAPAGYKISTDPISGTLCYTTAPDSLIQSTADSTHMMLKDDAKFTFVDELIQPTIVLVKRDEGSHALPGAKFEVTGAMTAEATSAENGEILTIEKAADGEYKVVETEAPEGYNLLADEVKITVNGTDVKAFVGTKQIDGSDLTKTVDPATGITTVTIVIHNNSGVVLPDTGGAGSTLYTISGLALIACAAMLFVIRRREVA